MGIRGSWHLRGLVVGTLLFLAAIQARADLAVLEETGGGAMVMSDKATTVRMASETVEITLDGSDYTVRATFEFVNDGPEVTLPVGFPKRLNGGDYSSLNTTGYIAFKTSINGTSTTFTERSGPMKLRFQRIAAADTEIVLTDPAVIERARAGLQQGSKRVDIGINNVNNFYVDETRWYVKDVTFKANSTTIATVEYGDKYSKTGYAEYIYGTGRSWNGPIGQATFIVKSYPWVGTIRKPRFGSPGGASEQTYRLDQVDEFTHRFTLQNLEPAEDEIFSLLVRQRRF